MINQQKLIIMECTNLDLTKSNKRQSKKNSTIVFNNQTNKLIKQQDLIDKQLTAPIMGKYNLRKKSSPVKTRSDSIKKPNQIDTKHLRGLIDEDDKKPKKRNTSLSKYKRKHANARERSRVQEINAAFEILKNILPLNIFEQLRDNNRLTKISTLRSATKYIKILLELLNEKPAELTKNEINNCDNLSINKNNQQESNQKLPELTKNEIKNCGNLTLNENNKQELNSLPNIDISPNELSRLSFNEEFDELNKQTNVINNINALPVECKTSESSFENSNQSLSTESEMLNSIIDFDAPIECEFDDLSDIKNNNIKNNIPINIQQPVNYNQINIAPVRNDVQLNIQYHQLNSSPLNNQPQQLNCINSDFKYINNTVLQGSNKYSKINSFNTPLIEKNNDHNLPSFYFDPITKLNEPIFKDEDLLSFLGEEDIENESFQYSTGDLMI